MSWNLVLALLRKIQDADVEQNQLPHDKHAARRVSICTAVPVT